MSNHKSQNNSDIVQCLTLSFFYIRLVLSVVLVPANNLQITQVEQHYRYVLLKINRWDSNFLNTHLIQVIQIWQPESKRDLRKTCQVSGFSKNTGTKYQPTLSPTIVGCHNCEKNSGNVYFYRVFPFVSPFLFEFAVYSPRCPCRPVQENKHWVL